MKYDPVLAAMLAEPWSNNACRGYVIYAMENCGFSPEVLAPGRNSHFGCNRNRQFELR